MFSEMMRMRPACARKPEAAIDSVLTKSIVVLRRPYVRLALAKRGLDEIEAACVEGRRRLEIHLVGGNFHHFFLEVHRIAGRAHFEGARIGIPVRRFAQTDALDMAIRGERERAHGILACRNWRRFQPEPFAAPAPNQGACGAWKESECQ